MEGVDNMYTEDQENIRQHLSQFFGGILVSSNLKDPSLKKQSLIALVTEEITKLCKTEDGEIDMIAAKPILRSTNYILESRKKQIQDLGIKIPNEIEDANTALCKYIEHLDK